MLYGPFLKSFEAGAWTQGLSEDDPAARAMLLQFMLGRFDIRSSSFHDTTGRLRLYKITVRTDEYDMAHLLRPWADKLVQSLEPLANALSSYSKDTEVAL